MHVMRAGFGALLKVVLFFYCARWVNILFPIYPFFTYKQGRKILVFQYCVLMSTYSNRLLPLSTETRRSRIQRDDFGARRERFESHGFVCQTKEVNSRDHIPERLVGQRLDRPSRVMVFYVNQKGEIFVRGKSIDESSFGFSLLALYINSGANNEASNKKQSDRPREFI